MNSHINRTPQIAGLSRTGIAMMRTFSAKAFATLIIATAANLATAQELPTPATPADSVSDGMISTQFFVDPATGLKWASQLMGPAYTTTYTPEGVKQRLKIKVAGACPHDASCFFSECREQEELACSRDDIELSWWASVSFVNGMTLDDQTGWRLPSRAELEDILPKLGTPDYPADYKFLTYCRTTDAGKSPGTVLVYDRNFRESQKTRGFVEEPATKTSYVCAVRGSSQSPEFEKVVARALTWNGDANYPVSENQITATEQRVQEANVAQKYLADEQKKKQEMEKQLNAQIAQRKARLIALRANPKPGDKAQQGLVLEAKGDLVRLQQHERVCVTTSGSACSEWQVRETGHQVWVRKSDLQLP